ncbi:MAG: hypothetical protein C4533_06205 [Candidatus Omnitrophota bacterium]|jgi:hypothetical protein|nr:MAG: hypothetical protein C4533_06205 [Candidatus Omnitrophota bacterium]
MLRKLIFLIGLCFILSGCCSILNNRVCLLKRFSANRSGIESLLNRQEDGFYRLRDDIKNNKLKTGLSKNKIISEYYSPVFSYLRDKDKNITKVLVYRHPTEYFSSELIYLFFDRRNRLTAWQLFEPPDLSVL